jgi:hypothetical protein
VPTNVTPVGGMGAINKPVQISHKHVELSVLAYKGSFLTCPIQINFTSPNLHKIKHHYNATISRKILGN